MQMIKLNHLIRDHLLYEGLIYSVSKTKFNDMINRWAISTEKIKIVPKNGNIIIISFIKPPSEKELDNLLKLINNLGWYISAGLLNKENMKWKKFDKNDFKNNSPLLNILIAIQAEAKFDPELTDMEFSVLYHATPSINDNKIRKIGLVPKSLSKISYHPERIYFTRTEDEAELIANRFFELNNTLKEFSLYKIDINAAMEDNPQLRLFDDPLFKDGIYTLSNISPIFITFLRMNDM